MREIYDARHSRDFKWYVLYAPNFMTVGARIRAILRICLRHLTGYNVGINDGRNL
jgi:hypothetical protein